MLNPSIEKSADRGDGTSAAQMKKMYKSSGSSIIATVKSVFRVNSERNYYTIRLKMESVLPKAHPIEGIVSLAKASEKIFRKKLEANGFILGDKKLPLDDPRVLRLAMEEKEMAETPLGGRFSRV